MKQVNVNFYFYRNDKVDYIIPYHTHKCYELVYYVEGKGHCNVNDRVYDYCSGNYVIIPPDSRHDDVHEENCVLYCIGFTYDPEEDILPEGVFSDMSGKIGKYLSFIAEEFAEQKEEFNTVVNNFMYNLLTEIKRDQLLMMDEGEPQSNAVQLALNYFREYYHTDITPEQLSEIIHYSYHHFRHLFKKQMGISPKQYLINKRISNAKKLLAETDLSITDIGSQCGFSTTSLFIKQFRARTMVTPSEYRRQLQSSQFTGAQSDYETE